MFNLSICSDATARFQANDQSITVIKPQGLHMTTTHGSTLYIKVRPLFLCTYFSFSSASKRDRWRRTETQKAKDT